MSGASQVPLYPPVSLSQTLSRIHRAIRANLRILLGIAAPPAIGIFVAYAIPFALVGSAFLPAILQGKQPPVPQMTMVMFAAVIAFMLVYLIGLGIFAAAASYAGVMLDCGMPVTVKEAYKVARDRAGHYIALLLTLYGICFGPLLLIEAAMFGTMATFASNKTMAPVLMLLFPIGMLLLVASMIAGVVILLRLSLAFPASIFERLDLKQSIKRSWALTRGAAGRIFIVLLVVYAAMYLAMLVVMIVGMIVAIIGYLVFSSALAHPGMHTIVTLVVCAATAYVALISAFGACFWTGLAASLSVIYNDQRLRMATMQDAEPAGASA